MVLSAEQLALLPTEEDIAFYESHGWYVSPKIIPDEVFEVAKIGAERFYRGERDIEWPYTSGFSEWNPEQTDAIRNDQYVAFRIKELRYLALQPVIGAIAARLARTTEIRLLDDALVYKPPQSKGVVGWHVDRAYWGNCTSDNMLTAWIPFHDCEEAHGPMMVCDKSHFWRGTEHTRLFNNQDLDWVEAYFRDRGYPLQRLPLTLKKGQISFHHCWTLHGSEPNAPGMTRLSMTVHLQDKDNRYRPYRNPQGKEIHMFNENLCRTLPNGLPDFSDPDAFPVLWSADQLEETVMSLIL